MERNVTVIPATRKTPHNSAVTSQKRKVAGYARVSTDKDEQFTSYEAQVDYYTRYINNHPGWEFVKVYTDEGISGLGTRSREGFNEMISDALSGKIDLIVTKSVSRFARNTVDSLVTIRKLKEKNVEVYFEKENIYSLDGKGELLLTIMSSLAQEESRSISENVTWGQRKRFSDGKVRLPYKHFLGYDRGENRDDPPVVNHGQAAVVRRIYRSFMAGKTPYMIAKDLEADSVPSPGGKARWRSSTITSILTNEKYRGSARLQKSFTTDYLTKKKKKNEGEIPQYYVEHSHEPIIDPAEWDFVQEEISRRKLIGRSYSCSSDLGVKIKCGDCGSWYGPKVWHSNDKYRKTVWRCNGKYDKSKKQCRTPSLSEYDIKKRFISAYNRMITDKTPYIEACESALSVLTDTSAVDKETGELRLEMDVLNGLQRKAFEENGNTVSDTDYADRFEKLARRYEKLTALRDEKIKKGRAVESFMSELKKRNDLLTEFDIRLWITALDVATVNRDGSITFRFNDGTVITE